MIDLEGNEIWSASKDVSGDDLFENPHSLAVTVIDDKTTILVSDWRKKRIVSLDASNGYLVKTVDMKGKDPHGITVDGDLNVYTCHVNPKEICVWSPNFEQCRVVLSGKDLHSTPVYITCNDNLNELYVCSHSKDRIDRISLSK